MARRSGASRGFTIFAVLMVAMLVLSSVVLFGGSLFGTSNEREQSPQDEAERQLSELETQVAEDPSDGDAAGVLANVYANEGNLAQAIPLYERATTTRPKDGNLRLAFGIALLRSGNLLDARVQLERALELIPSSSGPSYYLGQLEQLRDEPDLEVVRRWYEQAIETDPDSTLASQAREKLNELDSSDATAVP